MHLLSIYLLFSRYGVYLPLDSIILHNFTKKSTKTSKKNLKNIIGGCMGPRLFSIKNIY